MEHTGITMRFNFGLYIRSNPNSTFNLKNAF